MTQRELYIWDTLTELGIATDEEIGLVTALNGRNENVLNDILYVRTGYRTIEQMFEEEEDRQSFSFINKTNIRSPHIAAGHALAR